MRFSYSLSYIFTYRLYICNFLEYVTKSTYRYVESTVEFMVCNFKKGCIYKIMKRYRLIKSENNDK